MKSRNESQESQTTAVINGPMVMKGWVNPLSFTDVDLPLGQEITYESLINFLCTPGTKSDLDSLLRRYKEISIEKRRLVVAPAEEHLLENLIWPLRNAKVCYVLGNYIGAIALCGIVAEMVTILLFDMNSYFINNKDLTDTDQRRIWGKTFKELDQARRIQILLGFDTIHERMSENLDYIRKRRNRVLHDWSKDHEALPTDTRDVFAKTIDIVVDVIGQDFKDGLIVLSPKLINYLKKLDNGIIQRD